MESALCDNRPSSGNRKSTKPGGRAIAAHRIAGMMAANISRLAPFRGIDFVHTFIVVGRLNTRLILTSWKLGDAGFAKLGETGYRVREARLEACYIGVHFDRQWPTSEGRKFMRSAEMGLLCPRERSARFGTSIADKNCFWTENADMFSAAKLPRAPQ